MNVAKGQVLQMVVTDQGGDGLGNGANISGFITLVQKASGADTNTSLVYLEGSDVSDGLERSFTVGEEKTASSIPPTNSPSEETTEEVEEAEETAITIPESRYPVEIHVTYDARPHETWWSLWNSQTSISIYKQPPSTTILPGQTITTSLGFFPTGMYYLLLQDTYGDGMQMAVNNTSNTTSSQNQTAVSTAGRVQVTQNIGGRIQAVVDAPGVFDYRLRLPFVIGP